MDTILLGFEQISSQSVMIALVAGAVLGVVLGAIPGLGPAVGIAILLPTTFQMEPLTALTLLLGIYCGAWYGGAIPAILINTPGTAVNVLTTYDGYPMAKNGQAKRALALAYSSSFMGGILSIFALMFLASYVALFAKKFGSMEFAMAALLGMFMVVIAHRGRELLAASFLGFGFFLSTIGIEKVHYTQRFTFEQEFMLGGVPLVPSILGLFAISQAFILLESRRKTPDAGNTKISGSAWQGFKEIFQYPKTVGSSSAFGIIMGVIPGVGEFLAQFFSYSLARKQSKTPEKFGKGAPEGLIASETANNAVPAAALVPLLALGIPGEALTAMMLTVFTVHNVVPGPTLFTERPEFISGLYVSLFMMNVIILVLLLIAGRWLIKIVSVRNRVLGMIVLTLSFIGVYTANYNIIDCVIALFFAIIGYLAKRNDIPVMPIILGLVLGPIFEDRLRQVLAFTKGDLTVIFDRPISLSILMIILVVLTAIMINKIKHN